MKKVGVSGMVNPFIYRISVESPIVKERASVFASFRHSTFNWLFRRAAPDLDVSFYDYNVKFKYKINEKNRLFYSFYSGQDNISNMSSENLGFGIDWSNFASTLRWNHIFNDKLFSNTTIYGSAYNYNLNVNETDEIKWNAYIRNFSIKSDLSFYLRAHHTIKFGYALNIHSFNPGNINLEEVAAVPQKQSNQVVLYIDDSYQFNDKWSLGLGVRFSTWSNSGPSTVYTFDQTYQVNDTIVTNENKNYKTYFNLDPRIHLKYQLGKQSSLKLSYGIYHQYIHLLSNASGPFTSLDVWVPSGVNIKPQRSDILAFGHHLWFVKNKYELVTELYYKRMSHQIGYADHANMLLNPLMEGELRFGNANAYGLELMLRKRKGRLSGWLSYTYSRVLMQFDELNHGKTFPAYFDKPHSISLYGSYRLSERWFLSANWIFASGSPISSPTGFYTYMDNTIPVYGDVNNDRLPNYHRLDLSINWRLNKQIKRFKHRIAFSIYNLYNQKNAIGRHHNKINTGDNNFAIPSNVYNQDQMITSETYMLGFMPSFTYKFEF
jgi:outer membrane receptor for ferrienterochelin and colicin